jgi:Zn-dependent metalloprotease
MNSEVAAYMKGKISRKLFAIALVVAVLFACGTAMAQPKFSPAETKESKELKKYLKEKYVHISEVRSSKEKSHWGIRKRINIIGSIAPKAEVKGKDKRERSKAVSKAFILGEPSIFGITREDEITEVKVNQGTRGHAYFRYRRNIEGLPLLGMEILMSVGPDEKVTSVSAHIFQAPPELYKAARKKTISKDEAASIIRKDLAQEVVVGVIQILNIEKYAVASPPWVIWEGDVNMATGEPGRWLYRIDAFTGEIISKRSDLQSIDRF